MIFGDSPRALKRDSSMMETSNSQGEHIPYYKAVLSSPKEHLKLLSTKKQVSDHNIDSLKDVTHSNVIKDQADQNEMGMQINQLVMQAALGDCRWPPYLLVAWVILQVLSHAMHSLLALLSQALPHVKLFSRYLLSRTFDTYHDEDQKHRRALSATLAVASLSIYSVYLSLYAGQAIVQWFLKPLSMKQKPCGVEKEYTECSSKQDVNITSYEDDANVKV